jgi:hypothetical protein
VTMYRPPRRILVKLGNGVELIEFVRPGQFGPRIVNEGPVHQEPSEFVPPSRGSNVE